MKKYYHQKGVEIPGFPPPYRCEILAEYHDGFKINCPIVQDYFFISHPLNVPKDTVFDEEESQ